MQTRLPRLALAALLVAVLAVGAWLTWRHLGPDASNAALLVRLEEALGGPGSVAVAHVDVERMRPLLANAAPAVESALLSLTGLPEARARGELAHVFLSLSRADEHLESAAVLLGRFDVAAIERRLGAAAGGLEESLQAGERVLYVDRIDPETCRASRLGVALGAGRIVVAGSGSLGPLLARLGSAGLELRESQAQDALLGLRWSGALELPAEIRSPGAHALFAALRAAQGEATALRASARPDRRGRIALDVEVSTADAAAAIALLERWGADREARRAGWSRSMPALARWSAALELSSVGPSVRGVAQLDAGSADWPQLADDVLVLAASHFPASPSSPGAAEIWPAVFRDEHPLWKLPAYRSDAPLAGAADAIAGPFGIRIEAARAPDGIELELRAVGPDVPNLPAPDASPRLFVEAVESSAGESLLDPQTCGAGRRAAARPLLRSSPAALLEAKQRLRLRRGTGLDAVARIRGRVELDLPVRTQTLRLGTLEPGARIEGPGVSLELGARSAFGFAYRVRGAPANLLHMRGLDAAGAPLAGREAWQAELPASGDRIGALRHAGVPASLEAVFALERQRATHPFELVSARPGSEGEAMHVESSSFIDYSAEQYDREFGALPVDTRPPRQRFVALASAGPFRIGLGELASDGVIAPRLTVIAPDIPNLTYDAGALVLELTRVVLRDGRELDPRVRVAVAPGHRFGNLELEAEVRAASGVAAAASDVERLAGELLLRIPARVERIELAPVDPGVSAASGRARFTLSELTRDGFALAMRGPPGRFFSARAFAADDRELAVKHLSTSAAGADGSRELRFRVQGQPHRLAIQLARGAVTRRYGFELVPAPPALPAATAP